MASTESVSHQGLIVCAVGDLEYTARDAIEAALFRGDLESAWQNFLQRVESEKRADEAEMDLDEDAFDAAAEAFRYQHDLITAEETEQWLAARGLTVDDFSDYFSRQCWGAAEIENVKIPETGYVTASGEMRDLFTVEVILSGELERMTTQLSWRLAALAARKESDAGAIETETFFERHGLKAKQLTDWLERLGRDADWFEKMAAMEASYKARAAAQLVPQAFQSELNSLRMPLTRFEAETIELESRDAAQEALFCVQEDGMSMEEVAKESHYPYRRDDFVLEDVPEEIQQTLLSVAVGQILEPLPRGDGFELCRVLKKVEPRAEDPAVHARIEHRLLHRHFSELVAKYVERRIGAIVSAE
jgi:hypothetical protein